MTNSIEKSIGQRLGEIRKAILEQNSEGNLNGLFHQFVLDGQFDLQLKTGVDETWVETNKSIILEGNYVLLSSLGYSVYLELPAKGTTEIFSSGLQKMKRKDPFPGDRQSFVFYPRETMGIALGILRMGPVMNDEKHWLNEILVKRASIDPIIPRHALIFAIIESLFTGRQVEVGTSYIRKLEAFSDLCLLYFVLKRGYGRLANPQIHEQLSKKIIENFLDSEDPAESWLYSVVYFSVKSCLLESLSELALSPDHVSHVLTNFEPAMRRWQWSSKKKWEITDEHDVQSVLWLVLRSIFDDVIDEEPAGRSGHGFSIIDFKIPSLELLVEAKFIRKREDFKRIEDEIKIDV
ncbi:MAG: hypothetical protein ACRDF4_07415, partial [Rhabdochlamydiaceae bacterium]